MDVEKKFTSITEVKELSDDGEFEGYASIFGEVDQGMDSVERGAYRASLKTGPMPKMLWQHDPTQPIGKWLEVQEDEKGLKVRGKIIEATAKGAEALVLMREKVLDGLSIGYRTKKAMRDETTGIRKLLEVELWEISLVTFPMLPTATVDSVKGDWTKTDISRVLRNAGAPSGFVKKLISGGYDLASHTSETPCNGGDDEIAAMLRQATQQMRGM